jgi:hypothetical protein
MNMKHRFVGWLSLCGAAAALGGCASAISEEATRDSAPLVPGALTAAHEAYLDGDFLAVGELVRDVLLDPGASDRVKENAFELLDKAYEVQGGALPSRFKLPADYGSLQYVIFRNMTPNGPSFQVHARVLTRDPSHLTGFTVRRLPGETLLDKATGKGHFEVLHSPGVQKAGFDEVVLDSGPIAAPPADGVLSVRLELDDGTVSEGFAIGRALGSEATPEVRSPAPWASISDPNPKVAWAPFRSPQCASFERRAIGVQVAQAGVRDLVWELWSNNADAGKTALSPGDYQLLVVAGEIRSFGPVDLIRGSRTAQPFHVAP